MRYADAKCICEEKFEPEHTYTFTGPCFITGKSVSVTVKAKELYAYRAGALIQDAFKSLSKDDREFLMSGFSKEGWDMAFPEDE